MHRRWISVITDEDRRLRMQILTVFLLLAVVAFCMTVLNLFTHKGALTLVTGVFCVLCFLNFVLVHWGRDREKGMKTASLLFMIELGAMFTFFIVSGNPDGFSVIWLAMLPVGKTYIISLSS